MRHPPTRLSVPTHCLAECRPGQRAYVRGIRGNGLVRRRLLDLGFVPGARVEVVLESPAGDPAVYRVCESNIALRKSVASQVEIAERVEPDGRSPRPCASCRRVARSEALSARADTNGSCYVVALAGNPNTGKSTVFNALTGLRQHVGNWPGKTVMRVEGSWAYEKTRFRVVDLPGTYSLLSTSTDEEIARDYVLFGSPDCTVVVADGTCLKRNLNLVFQILEITDRVVVCVNLIDEARRKGIHVDRQVLEDSLGVPVVLTAARSGEGMNDLKQRILDIAAGRIRTSPARITYEPELQQAIEDLTLDIERAFPDLPNARWIAMRLIDGGDARLRAEIDAGVLAELGGRIGAASLPGAVSPTRRGARSPEANGRRRRGR